MRIERVVKDEPFANIEELPAFDQGSSHQRLPSPRQPRLGCERWHQPQRCERVTAFQVQFLDRKPADIAKEVGA